MERFTEDYGVRYIAVTDNIDSAKGLDDMTAVRELFNEFYPRDTSKKIRAVFTSKGNSGQRLCTQVPYGYKGDKYKWEVDEEAAQVVREIFSLCMAGLGPMQISKRLKAAGVLTPTAYKLEKGLSVTHKPTADPCGWDAPGSGKNPGAHGVPGLYGELQDPQEVVQVQKDAVSPPGGMEGVSRHPPGHHRP